MSRSGKVYSGASKGSISSALKFKGAIIQIRVGGEVNWLDTAGKWMG